LAKYKKYDPAFDAVVTRPATVDTVLTAVICTTPPAVISSSEPATIEAVVPATTENEPFGTDMV
jgi:hypothetical protein